MHDSVTDAGATGAVRPAWTGTRAGAALLLSLVTGAVGTLWIARPSSYPFGSRDRVTVSVTHLIEHRAAGAMLLVAAVAGLLVAAVTALGTTGRTSLRVAAGVAVAEALFFGLVMADVTLMNSLAYGLGLLAPVGLVLLVGFACVKGYRSGYLAAALVAVALVAGAMTGVLAAVPRFYRNLGDNFASYQNRVAWGVAMAFIAAGWVWLGYTLVRQVRSARGRAGRPGWATPEGARRWGRVVTIAAAVCPLPYAFVRMLWLTPWPLDLAPEMDSFATRMQGASIGAGAIIGSVLTFGLISRWGEVLPRWVPVLGGRPVPPLLAVVPGGLVAAAACIAAPGFLVSLVESNGDGNGVAGMLLTLLLFPFPIWGPLLGAAVLAYRLRRSGRGAAGPALAAQSA